MNFLQIFEIVLLADVLDGKLPILNAGCKKFKLFVNVKQIHIAHLWKNEGVAPLRELLYTKF